MRSTLLSIFAILFSISLHAQWSFGPRVGIGASTTKNESVVVVIHSDAVAYDLNFIGNSISKSFGIDVERTFDYAFLQFAALHSSYSSSYDVAVYGEKSEDSKIYYEKYQNLEFPVLAGGRYKNFRLGAGPIFSYNLSTKSDFEDLPGVNLKDSEINFGSQAAFGVELGVFNIDVRYIHMVKAVGENLIFSNNVETGFKTRPSEIKVTIGTSF